jgi:hypothetical protein
MIFDFFEADIRGDDCPIQLRFATGFWRFAAHCNGSCLDPQRHLELGIARMYLKEEYHL